MDFIDSSTALLMVDLSKLLRQMDKIAAATGLATKTMDSIASARTVRSAAHPDAHCTLHKWLQVDVSLRTR
jgi:hypothetical protein